MKPKKVIGYNKKSKLPYILVEKTFSKDHVMVSTSKCWPKKWGAYIKNIEFVNGGKPQ